MIVWKMMQSIMLIFYQRSLYAKVLFLFILLSNVCCMNGQSLGEVIHISANDKVILHYNGNNGCNLIRDMYGQHLREDSLSTIIDILKNSFEKPKSESYHLHVPYIYLCIEKQDGTTILVSMDKQSIRLIDSSSYPWKQFSISKEDRPYVKLLIKKLKAEYKPKYMDYSGLPMCSRVRFHPSMFAGRNSFLVFFYVLTDSDEINLMNYYVSIKKGKIKVTRNVFDGMGIDYYYDGSDDNSIKSFLQNKCPDLPKESMQALGQIKEAIPQWDSLSEREKMSMLDGYASSNFK